jgi:hypothetical protein
MRESAASSVRLAGHNPFSRSPSAAREFLLHLLDRRMVRQLGSCVDFT